MKLNHRKMSARTAERLANARDALAFARQTIHDMPASDIHPVLFDAVTDGFRAILAEIAIADHFVN